MPKQHLTWMFVSDGLVNTNGGVSSNSVAAFVDAMDERLRRKVIIQPL